MREFEADDTQVTTPHLDDEAFAEMTLGGAPDHKAQAHLASCAQCRAELKRFEESVGGFSMASLAWSEGKSAELPALRPAAGGSTSVAHASPAMTGWGWALTAALALAVGIPVTLHENALRHEASSRAALDEDSSGLNSPEQIAQDNRLMADVNYELVHSRALDFELRRQLQRRMRGDAIRQPGGEGFAEERNQ